MSALRPIRVLVIDDSAYSRQAITRILDCGLGHAVLAQPVELARAGHERHVGTADVLSERQGSLLERTVAPERGARVARELVEQRKRQVAAEHE